MSQGDLVQAPAERRLGLSHVDTDGGQGDAPRRGRLHLPGDRLGRPAVQEPAHRRLGLPDRQGHPNEQHRREGR